MSETAQPSPPLALSSAPLTRLTTHITAHAIAHPPSGPYRGRFAPSPTGPLHAGSLVAALASWLDARMHRGTWLVRMEDIDTPRCVPGADQRILAQLATCGLHPDEPPIWQSQRGPHYQHALDQLLASHRAYPCGCTRSDIARALAAQGRTKPRHGELVYPGTCRNSLHGQAARAMRALTTDAAGFDTVITWADRHLGAQQQNLTQEVGDFVLRRADGLWAYQLAVVVDDAAQGITHVVRGQDLTDNTPRQIHLQRALHLPTPSYLHTPLVCNADGEKLSKQNGAPALDFSTTNRGDEKNVLHFLAQAGQALGLPQLEAATPPEWLTAATQAWAHTALTNGATS